MYLDIPLTGLLLLNRSIDLLYNHISFNKGLPLPLILSLLKSLYIFTVQIMGFIR